MSIINVSASGGKLTNHGKRMVAESMYAKGKSFVGAALLLRRRGGYEYVVLHLMCQGVEIVLKAMLLFRNYDSYKKRLKKDFGHDLEKLATGVIDEFGLHSLREDVATELKHLNSLYSKHLLRYGSFHDRLVNPSSIASRLVLRKIYAAIRLGDRSLCLEAHSQTSG